MKCNLLLIGMALSTMAHAQFSGAYAPANWTTTHYNTASSTATAFGSVNTSGAPASIEIIGPDGGTNAYANIRYSIVISQAGTVSFSYAINNTDRDGPTLDYFFWGKNSTMIDSVTVSGSGTVSVPVSAGQTFVMGVSAGDDQLGPVFATISNFTVSTAVPVKGTDLAIKNSGTGNVLSWTTFTEEYNKGFELQRSADAIHFSAIGFVPSKAVDGHAATALNYTFTDNDAAQPVLYYRYRQVDHDGQENYSNVVIMKKVTFSTQPVWSVYPNPVTKAQSLSLNNRSEGTLLLFDAKGALVYTQAVMKQAKIQLPGHLAAGSYFSVLQTAAGRQSATLVIK